MAKPQEMDKETAIATNAMWKCTVVLERFDSGKQLVCKGGTMNFTGVHSIRLNVSASAEGQEAPDNKEKLVQPCRQPLQSVSLLLRCSVGAVLCMVRYCRYFDDTDML